MSILDDIRDCAIEFEGDALIRMEAWGGASAYEHRQKGKAEGDLATARRVLEWVKEQEANG